MTSSSLDRSQWQLLFDDGFDTGLLDRDRWIPHYLPQWTTPERSACRYDVQDGVLTLRIDADQPPWRPEDGPMRVSNLQTAVFSGPVGSGAGTHRHVDGLKVRTAVPARRLYTPESGLVEARLRATAEPTCMLALWLVGVEDRSPAQSGEICVVELYGDRVGPVGSTGRIGMKSHHDPSLTDDMADVPLQLDASDWHTWAVDWDADCTRFFVDGHLVRQVAQGIDYPLQLMLGLFELPQDDARAGRYPKTAHVAHVRGYRRRAVV